MSVPTPEVRVFAYEVRLDLGRRDVRPAVRIVKHLGDDVWAVTEDGFDYAYDASGEHGYFSSPDRRFDLETATRVAQDLVRAEVAGALAWTAEREAREA